MKSIKALKNIRGKRVLVRVDFNVPIARGKVADDTRIQEAVPTLKWLVQKGAKVIVATHFGRPATRIKNVKLKMKNELGPIAEQLSELLKRKVQIVGTLSVPKTPLSGVEEWNFQALAKQVKKMKAGEVLLLPNLRLHSGEEKNNPEFAAQLAWLGQIYVNEAFSVCHRAHASVVGVPKLLPSYAGLRLEKEVEVLSRVLRAPKKPLIVLVGGVKITDKIVMMKTLLRKADAVLVGGVLANHFFKALGYGIGASLIEPAGVRLAKQLIKEKKIILPKDVVVGTKDGEVAKVVEVLVGRGFIPRRGGALGPALQVCSRSHGIWDIGPQTILDFARQIKRGRTLIWNGPLGLYEVKPYSHGTLALGRLFAARSRGRAFGVVGGGETIDALKKTGMREYVDFISTGGGAMLEFLGGSKLPGLQALEYGK